MAEPGTAASPVPERPYLRPWYRLAQDGDRILLEYGQAVTVLEGKSVPSLLRALLPLLDGTRTVDQLAAVLGPRIRPAIDKALETLAASALLCDGPPLDATAPPDARETAELLVAVGPRDLRLTRVAESLAAATVGVVGGGPAEEATRLLLGGGVGAVALLDWEAPPADGPDLVLAFPSPRELPRLASWNEAMLRTDTPWLQVLPFDGRMAAVGPLFLPREGCCHRCFVLRRSAASTYRSEFWALDGVPAAYPSPRWLASLSAAVATVVALRWLAWHDPLVPGRLLALELGEGFDASPHCVYRVPRCPACSGLAGVAPPLPWFKDEPVARR